MFHWFDGNDIGFLNSIVKLKYCKWNCCRDVVVLLQPTRDVKHNYWSSSHHNMPSLQYCIKKFPSKMCTVRMSLTLKNLCIYLLTFAMYSCVTRPALTVVGIHIIFTSSSVMTWIALTSIENYKSHIQYYDMPVETRAIRFISCTLT